MNRTNTRMDIDKMSSLSQIENPNDVDEWFLMSSPPPMLVISASYLLIVLKLGPEYMKNREPYKFEKILPLYNAFQVLISCYLFYLYVTVMGSHGLFPKICLMDSDFIRKKVEVGTYFYLLAKISELFDTILFVLRKKDNQVSFLHVYHHAIMVVATWIVLKYEPTYSLMFMVLINSFVHILMYTYYALSMFPTMTKYLWWKKYITRIQIAQFMTVLLHFGVASMKSECKPSTILTIAMATNGFLFLYLFGSFYIRTYVKTESSKSVYDDKTKMDGITANIYYAVHKDMCYTNGAEVSNDSNKQISNAMNSTSESRTLNNTYRIRYMSKK